MSANCMDSKFIERICSSMTPCSRRCAIINFSRLDLPQRRIPVTTLMISIS